MNEKTVGMLIGKKNVYEYLELSNAVTCMNYVNKETEIPPVLMMHGLAVDRAWRSGILDREEYGYFFILYQILLPAILRSHSLLSEFQILPR